MNFSAVLMAGGRSRRMGQDKATLAWGGMTLIEHQARTLRDTGAAELWISCQASAVRVCEGFRLVTDGHADAGPASALADAWGATSAEVLVVLALDMPRMRAEYLRALVSEAQHGSRSVVPMIGGFYEPLAAAWHRSSASAFANAQHRSMQAVCRELAGAGRLVAREVSAREEAMFANLNTPEDYARMVAQVQSESE